MKYKLADIKKCPFCGALPVMPKKDGCLGYSMTCRGRNCRVWLYDDNKVKLIEKWNKRR